MTIVSQQYYRKRFEYHVFSRKKFLTVIFVVCMPTKSSGLTSNVNKRRKPCCRKETARCRVLSAPPPYFIRNLGMISLEQIDASLPSDSEYPRLILYNMFFKKSKLYDQGTPTFQTNGQTDRRLNTA